MTTVTSCDLNDGHTCPGPEISHHSVLWDQQKYCSFQSHFSCFRFSGVELYDPRNQVCCMGKVHTVNPDAEAQSFCCGQEPYDLRTSLCCQNVVLPRSGNSVSCCGSATYDVTTSLCCDGNVVDLEFQQPTDYSSRQYQDNSDDAVNTDTMDTVRQQCCGREAYDIHTHVCCESDIRQRINPVLECCGGAEYDITRELCCHGHIHPNNDHDDVALFCCYTDVYNGQKELCCNGQVRQKPDPSVTYACCGDQLQDIDSEMCCDQTVVPSTPSSDNVTLECCGQTTYDPNSQMCCDGIPRVRKPTEEMNDNNVDWTACCGTETYSRTSATCCGGHVRPFPDLEKPLTPYRCCGQNLLTDPTSELCCDGQVFKRFSTMTACCGGTTYEIDQDMCCHGKRKIRTSVGDQCCGDEFYDMLTQLCCYENGFQVLNKTGTATMCCSQPQNLDDHKNGNY